MLSVQRYPLLVIHCQEETKQLTCRASRLVGFCSIRAATEGYFRTDNSSKILLLLNLIFFINVFELVIPADLYLTSTMIVQREGVFSFVWMFGCISFRFLAG